MSLQHFARKNIFVCKMVAVCDVKALAEWRHTEHDDQMLVQLLL